MCGFCGFIDFTGKDSEEVLNSMIATLNHRGPDDSGIKVIRERQATIGFAHKRLSIIDLSPLGHQPMFYKHLSIIYNGEIYNFQEIKDDLIDKGHDFLSECDTEVILHAYEEWGVNGVKKFIGMFAFAIYDGNKKELLLFRDRVGVKPHFVYLSNNLILFGSELKSFHANRQFKKDIDLHALSLYLKYGYIPQPHTIFKNTFKIKSGHFFKIELENLNVEEHCYWDVNDYYNKPKLNLTEEEILLESENILTSACNYRMISDVPVGVFLSGGYDSSLVTALLQSSQSTKIKTFTIGLEDEKYDEAPYAKGIAEHLKTDHHEYYCTVKETQEIIPELPYYYDEPFGDSSSIPTILVSRQARKNVTVVLSADAGDEIFAGYNKYVTNINNFNKLKKIPKPISNFLGQLIKFYPAEYVLGINKKNRFKHFYESLGEILREGNEISLINKLQQQRINNNELKKLILQPLVEPFTYFDSVSDISSVNDELNTLLAIDFKTYLPDDILTKVDRATMSVSLEGREPLLDHRIIEFAAQLPSEIKYKNNTQKHILKKITNKYIPKELMDRPKKGFSIPINSWLRNEYLDLLEECLNEKRIIDQGIFNYQYVKTLKKKYLAGNDADFELLWFLVVFQMWYKKWM